MKKMIILGVLLVSLLLCSCSTKSYEQGYNAGFIDGFESCMENFNRENSTHSDDSVTENSLPLAIIESDIYDLFLIDAYQSEEEYSEYWDEEIRCEECYIFKFRFHNKHNSSNIRVALVDAAINGYSLSGTSNAHSDDSFSVYTWAGDKPDSSAADCFKLYFSDIEAATDIRDANKMGNANLSFIFRAYIIGEMEDYGEDTLFTIENAFQYCG